MVFCTKTIGLFIANFLSSLISRLSSNLCISLLNLAVLSV